VIEARFDDLSPGHERSFRLTGPVGVVEAHRPDEVPGAVEAAASAAARGLWAGGFVSYEGAPGLNADLVVHERPTEGPLARLPLAWFAMFEGREAVAAPEPPLQLPPVPSESPWRPSVSRDRFEERVRRIRELIAAGDTYQVNYTIRLHAQVAGAERGLYRDLCLAQRGGYAAYINTGRSRVLSASPELFFRIDGDRITTRPMKGTAPRGRWLEEDEANLERLIASAKERAENAMIVDLLRNDLGRISRPGSVRVESMFDPERYETVWQLTSTISSELVPGASLLDVFGSLFPSGSVTGAPKVRTMQLIASLEDSPRGVYCGAVGYLAPSGSGEPSANFNVAIRTVVLDADSGTAEYGVGGGVTHDSSPEGEYAEVLAKSRVLTAVRPAFALFETLVHIPGEGFRHLQEHLGRLSSSARYFGFACDGDEILTALDGAVSGAVEPVRVRLTLARDGALETEVRPVPPAGDGPVRVALDDEPVDPNDAWLFHKTTNRTRYDRRRSKRPDAEDVVLVNTRGEVTESTIANLAARIGGAWVTPPRDSGLLGGTYREVLLREGRLAERSITVAELVAAEEIALVSSVRGWREAVLLP
jgi:para-aminobenzoate synthetase / 4-amino-4-deoxychorismate lyase